LEQYNTAIIRAQEYTILANGEQQEGLLRLLSEPGDGDSMLFQNVNFY
jgi:hypothetical protein